jgi:serine protease Do/serine protease DegQ
MKKLIHLGGMVILGCLGLIATNVWASLSNNPTLNTSHFFHPYPKVAHKPLLKPKNEVIASPKIIKQAKSKVEVPMNGMPAVLKRIMPAVVNVTNQGEIDLVKNPFLKQELLQEKALAPLLKKKPFIGVGSGVILDAEKGLIVTNAHVVSLNKKITVTLNDGRRFEAQKLGVDNKNDIALLQIRAENLVAIEWGDSNQVQIGDAAFAIGSPFGLDQTVTAGMVSALHRAGIGLLSSYENFIQIDTPTNLGNSGGALVDRNGLLIGIPTALISPNGGNIGISLAIPVSTVRQVVEQILKYGNIKHGMMGILVQKLTPNLKEALQSPVQKGAVVSQVLPETPAQKAGIKAGDVIVQINQETVISNNDVHNAIGLLRPGDKVQIKLFRKGQPFNFKVKVIDPEKMAESQGKRVTDFTKKPPLWGVHLQDVAEQTLDAKFQKGIKVIDVDKYSNAFLEGLQPGDLIVEANHQPVHSLEELAKQTDSAKQSLLLLRVARGKNHAFIALR